jgi:hypothetical protein
MTTNPAPGVHRATSLRKKLSMQAFRDRLAARSGRSGDVVARDGDPGVDG